MKTPKNSKRYSDAFEQSKIKARSTLQDSARLKRLRDAVANKVESSKSRIYESLDDFYTLLRLLGAYATGEYREVSVKTMVAVVAVLIYFLNPMDLIPDFIATFGYLDDLSLLAYVIKNFKEEIDKFIVWEMEGKDVSDEV